MSDVTLSDDAPEIAAAARLDETLAHGGSAAELETDLDPELAGLIRELHARLGQGAPRPPAEQSRGDGRGNGMRQYGRFRLIRRLGGGTYGVVYLAHDPVLQREVSLKVPRVQTLESPDARRRFVREAQAAARLKHPHIVQVFQADVLGEEAYIATEYCAGPNLEVWLRGRTGPVAPRVAAAIAVNLADALGCAHEAGILHRDVKPSNVLLAENVASDDDVPARVRLADFGLARILEQEAGTATNDGALIGTFAYMAPEQVHRSKGDIGRATDVHALGVVLYELLTLQKPYAGETSSAMLLRICDEVPRSPRQLVTEIPRDLEAICLKCLEKSPARRYADGRELQADLQRFLAGEPTFARPLSPAEQGLRTIRRHPWGTGVVAALVLASVVVAAAVSYHNRRLGELLTQANTNLDLANARQAEVTDLLYVSDMRIALTARQQGDPATVRRQLARYQSMPDVRGIEWSILQGELCVPEATIQGHEGPIYSSVVSPDGRTLATAGKDGIIRLWDIATRAQIGELHGHAGEVNDIAFNADGAQLISGSDDQTARVWDVARRMTIQELPDPDGVVFGVAFSPDGKWIATGGKGKTVRLWSGAGELVERLGPLDSDVEQLLFSPDGAWLAAANGAAVRLWKIADWSRTRVLPTGPEARLSRMAFSRDGRLIAGACSNRCISLWDLDGGVRLAEWSGHRDVVDDLELAPDGTAVVSCGRDGTLRSWSIAGALAGKARDAHVIDTGGRPWSIAFGDEGRTVITSGHDGMLRYWTMVRLRERPTFGAVAQQVNSVRFSPDDTTLLVARQDGTVATWDVERREIETVFDTIRHTAACTAQYSLDGVTIATACENGDILVFPADGVGEPRRLSGHTRSVTGLCFLPATETTLCSCSFDGTVRRWDLSTGRETHREQFQPGDPLAIAVSPEGHRLAAGDGTQLVVWKLPAWEEKLRIPELHGKPDSLEFSADGRRLVSAHGDHVIQLRDLDSQAAAAVLTGHTGKVIGAVFSQDGRTIVSASADGTVRLWHVPTLQELGVLHRGAENFYSLSLSHDGRRLAAGYHGSGEQSGLLMWSAE